MANEIYKANDVQVRQQIKAHLDEADDDIAALDTRVTQNESDIDDLEAADVVLDGRLDDLEGYRPGMMQYDGSTGYYALSCTVSGDLVTVCGTFNVGSVTGADPVYVLAMAPTGSVRCYVQVGNASNADADFQDRLRFLVQNSAGTTICALYSNVDVADEQDHAFLCSFNGSTGAATFIVDEAAADNATAANRVAPTTGTLGTTSPTFSVGAFTAGEQKFPGKIGFVGYRDAYLTNFADFMDGNAPLDIDEAGWAEWGAQPLFWNAHGQMDRNLGSAGNMTKNGAVTLYLQGVESAWTVPDEELDARLTAVEPVTGTFTPAIWDTSNNSSESQTYSARSGVYRKVGDLVTVFIDITMSSLGTLTTSSAARIGDLPFSAKSTANGGAAGVIPVMFASGLAITAGVSLIGGINPGNSFIGIQKWSATTGTSAFLLSELTASGRIILSGTYIAA